MSIGYNEDEVTFAGSRVSEDHSKDETTFAGSRSSWDNNKKEAPKTLENSGGSCDYYKVYIPHPTTAKEPYIAECNDVIEELGMTYAESNMFKEIWRSAAARTLGKLKEGHNAARGADKIVFFAERNRIQKRI